MRCVVSARRTVLGVLGLCLSWVLGWPGEVIGDSGPEWAQFHGPRRDNKSEETGLLKQWPPGGPALLWTAKGIGGGYSTVSIAGGLIYTTGNIGPDTVITALDMDGKVKWTVKNGPAWEKPWPGTRGTPTIDSGRLYHEGAHGDVVCIDAQSGKAIWSLNILQKFGGRNIGWGLAESLLIDGDRIICTPGGTEAGIVALNKNTGDTVWVCKDTQDKPSYSSPVLFEYGGLRQIVRLMARSAVGLNADTGKLLWRYEHVSPYDENTMTVLYHDGHIFFSTRNTGAVLLKLNVEGDRESVTPVWQTKDMDNQHGGAVLVNGCLYGDCLTIRDGAAWACLDFATGKRLYGVPGVGRCSVTYADGMLYLYSQKGVVGLAPVGPEGFRIVSQFTVPPGGEGPNWAHPVVCGGRLYLRHGDLLFCYDIKAK